MANHDPVLVLVDILAGFLLSVLVGLFLWWLFLKWIVKYKYKKLAKINNDYHRLLQDEAHWKSLYEELGALDELGRKKWIEQMRDSYQR